MNHYTMGALVAFVLFGMGLTAAILGGINYHENRKSKAGRLMCNVCWCVFFWDFGYAWMSLCYESDIAYFARAVALLAITFYMIFILKYVAVVADYPRKRLNVFLWIFAFFSLVAWWEIIQKDAVSFDITPWGYWYSSSVSPARFVQFGSIIAALGQYYFILSYCKKRMTTKREQNVIKKFALFGYILFSGYVLDTLCPVVFHTYAIPGSSISAFVSAMVLFSISRNNKIFGLNRANVSEYVFRDVTMPVMITDSQGKIVLFNDSTKEYLRCPDSQLVHNVMDAFFETADGSFVRVRRTDKVCRLDKTDVRDQYGDLLYSIYFVQDVTEARKNYQMMQESQRIAEKANQAKSEFLANMSHEIRTPINAVLGMDEMILRESDDATVLEYAGNIKQAGNILLSLINDILDFSKIESGKMDIIPVEYEISSMINDLYSMNLPRAEKKGLVLKLNIDPQIPSKLYGDDMRIRQVIANLLTNAIKYTHAGVVTFSVEAIQKSGQKVALRVSVKDTGIGIRSEDLERLFTAFQRVDEKVNRNIEGTGLGLSITINLLRLMGSELKVNSVYGKGSEFSFILDQQIMDSVPIGNIGTKVSDAPKVVKEEYHETFRAPKAVILVVDDNEMNLQVVKGLLKNTQVQLVTALSGQESIELVKRQKFDVILMDHMMPDMDGIETVHRMRLLGEYPSKNAPIIALTANAVAGAQEMFLQNGFDDFLSKPVVGKKLEQTLMKYLAPELVEEPERKTSENQSSETWFGMKSEIPTKKATENLQSNAEGAKALPQGSKRIWVADGLGYCGGDEALYREILQLFVSENKTEQLRKAFEEEDFENYHILINALVAMAKNIGAIDFAEYVKKIDLAMSNNEIEYVKKVHEDFMEEYRKLLAELI